MFASDDPKLGRAFVLKVMKPLSILMDTARHVRATGMHLVDELILLTPLGTAPSGPGNLMRRTRKLTHVHQHVGIFYKGESQHREIGLSLILPDV